MKYDRRRKSIPVAVEKRRYAGAKRQNIYARLSPDEVEILDEMSETMGNVPRNAVVEEALRLYLPAVVQSGRFVQKGLPPAASKPAIYSIRSDIADALKRICSEQGWSRNEVIRHAIEALRERTPSAE